MNPDITTTPCAHCGAPIVWAYIANTAPAETMPINPEPDLDGTVVIVGHMAPCGRTRPVVKTVDGPDLFGSHHYTPHTCTKEPT